MNFHKPVLLDEVINFAQKSALAGVPRAFDGTYGGGGYSEALAQKGFEVYASDLDESVITSFDAINNPRIHLFHSSFDVCISNFDDSYFDYIVLDLGYSSNQLSHSDRGFSYNNRDELLDLRYDQTNGTPCWKRIADLNSQQELQSIIFRYSGEKHARSLSDKLYSVISLGKTHVGEIIEELDPLLKKYPEKRQSVLSRLWQALRIWTNDEFVVLEQFLLEAPKKLKQGGILSIVDFHSLEDKIITQFFRNICKPIPIDTFGNSKQQFILLTKKGISPTTSELEYNTRSRSALLRAIQKIDD